MATVKGLWTITLDKSNIISFHPNGSDCVKIIQGGNRQLSTYFLYEITVIEVHLKNVDVMCVFCVKTSLII